MNLFKKYQNTDQSREEKKRNEVFIILLTYRENSATKNVFLETYQKRRVGKKNAIK